MKCSSLVGLSYLLTACGCWPLSTKDQVSLQWSICDASPHTVLKKLGVMPQDPDKLDPITYYDTFPPIYTSRGLMFRTKTRGGREISVVKVRLTMPESRTHHLSNVCRWDRYGNVTAFVCRQQDYVERHHIWSEKQRQFAEKYQHPILWEKLVGYGPYPNPKWKTLRLGGRDAVLDSVIVGSTQFMELEVKVHSAEEDTTYSAITEHLRERGIVLCERQESKTMRLFRSMGYTPQDGYGDMHGYEL